MGLAERRCLCLLHCSRAGPSEDQRLRPFAFLDRLGALVTATWGDDPRKAHMAPAAEGTLLSAELRLQAARLVSQQAPTVRRNRAAASESSLCACRRREGKVRAA